MTRVIVAILVLGAFPGLAPAQQKPASQPAPRRPPPVVLVPGPVELKERIDLLLDPDKDPRLLVITGRRTGVANAVFDVNGATWGTASGFSSGTEKFEAGLPIVGAPPNSKKTSVTIRPTAPGVTIEQVSVVAASRVRFLIQDQASKGEIPGIATVESVDGKPPMPQGPFGGFPREGSSWISNDGNGDLYVPFNSSVTFSARSSPFRGLSRQRHNIDARDNLQLAFLLPADQLPDGSTILEAPMRPGIAPDVARAVDRARGIGRRPKDFRVVPASELLVNGPTVVDQALANPDVKFLATNEADPRLFPPTQLVTVELPGGELLHSNGPVVLLQDRRREGSAVRAYVKVRLPEGVVADKLLIISGSTRTEHPINGPSTIPLDVVAAPRTPIALVVMGPAARPDAPLDRAAALRVFRAP